MFRFYIIVQIKEDSGEKLTLTIENISEIANIISKANESFSGIDAVCEDFIERISQMYFSEFEIEYDGSGYNVLERIREHFYAIKTENVEKAKKLLEILDKMLYDYRDTKNITINKSVAFVDKEYFAEKVQDFNYDIIAYGLLKDLKL